MDEQDTLGEEDNHPPKYSKSRLKRMRKAELIEIAQGLELPKSGTKAELTERILSAVEEGEDEKGEFWPEEETEFEEEPKELYECPYCATVFEGRVSACPDCGNAFHYEEEAAEELNCPDCSTIITSEDTYCPECGLEFEKEIEPGKESEEEFELEEEFEEEAADSLESDGESLFSVGMEAEKPVMTGLSAAVIRAPIEGKHGLTNGPRRGRHGLINGLTNGLTNGLSAIRHGLTNGITNGNGIINGLGTGQVTAEKRRGLIKLFVICFFLILMLVSPWFLNVMVTPEDEIKIDGNFSDWSDVAFTSDSVETQPFNPNTDIVGYGVDSRLSSLSFYLSVEGNMLEGEPESSGRHMDTVYIFIDTDQFPKSGYMIRGIGADFMVKLEGWQGKIFYRGFYGFASDTQDWNFWKKNGKVTAGVTGSELEIKVGYDALNLKNRDKVDVIFYTQSYDGFEDFSDTVVSNEKGVLIVDQQGTGKGHISGNTNRMLRLDMSATEGDIVVTGIKLTRTGVGGDGDASSVRLMDDSNIIASGLLSNGFVNLQTNFMIAPGDSKTFEVEIDTGSSAQPENSIGFGIANPHDVTTNRGTITLRNSVPEEGHFDVSYIASVPLDIKVDGAFADWKEKDIRNDNEGDVDNRNLDIIEYCVSNTTEKVSFYLKVNGKMGWGTDVPYWNDETAPLPHKPAKPGGLKPALPLPPEPPRTGEDITYIYIDSDNKITTGFFMGGIGADHMIEIKGRYGEIISRRHSRFDGSTSFEWKWSDMGSVEAKTDLTSLETQITTDDLGTPENFTVYFQTTDWDESREDQSNEKVEVRGGRSSADEENSGADEDTYPSLLRLRAGAFDPLTEEPDVESELVTTTPNGYYIVQFKGPIQRSWKDDVRALGGSFYGYIPEYAFIVGIDDHRIDDVRGLPSVRWAGIYQPAYKVQEGLLSPDSDILGIDVLVFEDRGEVASEIEDLGGLIESESNSKLRIRINETHIRDILFIPDVEWVERTPQYRLSNNVSDDFERLNVNSTWGAPHYLNGTGQIVGVCDTGLDTGVNDSTMHDDFEGRIVSIYDLVGGAGETAADMRSGHGTHVAGSVLGNGAMSGGQIKGMAYGAQLVFQAVEDDQTGAISGIPSDLNVLFQQAYNDSARIHTNSWGSDVNGQYTSDSENMDEFVWTHQDMLILFSAGNYGTDSNSDGITDLDSLGAPATGKNCITVGASENLRSSGGYQISYGTGWPSDFPADPLNSDLVSNNSNGMVAFSSRGATDDGRIKPDVIAPGTNILSTRSSEASGTLWGVYNSYYVFSGGTSMSTPLVAGCAALVRQYYVDYEELTSPSGALIKATLINGATDISGQYNESGSVPNFNEGWGRANLTNSIFPASPRSMMYEDATTGFTSSGQIHTYHYPVDTGGPLKITLVWTDYPGTPTSGGLVNDLNLNVTAPDGTTYYYGNDFNNGWSNESHTFDDTNNVECVYIQSPSAGIYTVEVIGHNIAELGSQPDQDYALVLSGDFQFQDDVGVETLYVNRTQLRYTQAEITAAVKNFGSNNQTDPFDVRCVITNPENTEVLNNTLTVSSLQSLSSINLTWYHTPTLFGQYTVYVRTELGSDDYNENNASTKHMMVPMILSKLVTMTGTNSSDLFGFNVTSGHLNNDNYMDMIVGAPGANNVYVFYGSGSLNENLNAADADVILTGPDPDIRFGWSVGVSDVTGDSYDDVIVGAPAYNGSQGKAYIFHSSSAGLADTIADVNITGGGPGDRFGSSVSGGGNVNNVDNEDVIVGAYLNDTLSGALSDAGMAYLFFGTSNLIGNLSVTNADLNLTGKSTDEHFGFSVSLNCNVNNDDFDDIVVRAPGASKAYIFYGWRDISKGGYLVSMFADGFESGDFNYGGWTLSSPPPVVTNDHPYTGTYAAGGSVAIFGANDNTYSFQKTVSTSGFEDIVVSYFVAVEDGGPGTISFVASYSTDNGESWTDFEPAITNTNNVYISKIWDLSLVTAANNNPNFTIKFAGTFGGMAQSPSNAFWVDDVDVTGTVIPGSAIVNVTLTGENPDDDFGWSVGTSGNVNGDLYEDVVIGAPAHNSSQGRVYLFYGYSSLASSILASDANVTIIGPNPGDKFGYSVGGSDLGGDGYSDILVGAPYNDTLDGSKTDAGAVYVINGSAVMSQYIDAANSARYGENANDHFGWSVASAFDVNDDNFMDIIVGAPHYDSGSRVDTGKAYVLTIIPEYPQIEIPIIFIILVSVALRRGLRRAEKGTFVYLDNKK
ncbi:MAG: S8 family serine peptidase [Thermoplasmata archaeon]|nr:MAG: S8 family serine peptidase [Thermoplasmata archaeon]